MPLLFVALGLGIVALALTHKSVVTPPVGSVVSNLRPGCKYVLQIGAASGTSPGDIATELLAASAMMTVTGASGPVPAIDPATGAAFDTYRVSVTMKTTNKQALFTGDLQTMIAADVGAPWHVMAVLQA